MTYPLEVGRRHLSRSPPVCDARYAIGDRDALAFNGDGSLDLWLQRRSPGPERESNWLPAPPGAFNMVLRIYWPKPEALVSDSNPPGIERLPQ